MKKIVSLIIILLFWFSFPLLTLAEQDEPVAKKVGKVARSVKDGAQEVLQETKKIVKDTSSDAAKNSKSLWNETQKSTKKIWSDVKGGFQGDE